MFVGALKDSLPFTIWNRSHGYVCIDVGGTQTVTAIDLLDLTHPFERCADLEPA